MKKRAFFWAVGLALACLLYFFENNTGTRIVLACSLPLPFLLRRNEPQKQHQSRVQTVKAFADRETDDPGDVRAYLPCDPVNRIHWKLSAKRDELLVREQAQDQIVERTEKREVVPAEQPGGKSAKKRVLLLGFSVLLLSLVLLFAIPSAHQGLQALLNRLFDASEAVNAYAYERFAVPADQPAALAVILLLILGFSLLGVTLMTGSRLLGLILMAGAVLFQVYFGLSFPAWVNVPLFVFFALWSLRPLKKRIILPIFAALAVISLAVLLLYPGVDAATEAASETVRDRLSQMAQSVTGAAQELPSGENETRHVHTQSLTPGDQEARTGREYRLVTVEEQQISMPHWIDYLRIILLLLLAVALVILPFLPFILLNQRRKKALDARKAFQSENVSEAVFAMFQHIAAWLEATGHGGENVPYAAWNADLSPDYAQRFAACERLFEEAAYSTHAMNEEQRQQVLELLNETEQALQRQADWKQRLRLKYKECLWV